MSSRPGFRFGEFGEFGEIRVQAVFSFYSRAAHRLRFPHPVAQRAGVRDLQPPVDARLVVHVRAGADHDGGTRLNRVHVDVRTSTHIHIQWTRAVDRFFADAARVELVIPRPGAERVD